MPFIYDCGTTMQVGDHVTLHDEKGQVVCISENGYISALSEEDSYAPHEVGFCIWVESLQLYTLPEIFEDIVFIRRCDPVPVLYVIQR